MSNLGAAPKWCYLCGRPMAECAHRTYSPPPIQIPGPDDECPSCATLRAALAEAAGNAALYAKDTERVMAQRDAARTRAEAAEKERNFLNEKVVPTLEARAEAAEADADALADAGRALKHIHRMLPDGPLVERFDLPLDPETGEAVLAPAFRGGDDPACPHCAFMAALEAHEAAKGRR